MGTTGRAKGCAAGQPAGSDPAGLDDLTLVVRVQEGDAAAFEALARRHQTALYRVAVGVVGDPGEAEDALQESLVDAWRRIGSFRGEAAFSTWMYRIVTNRCVAMLRRRAPVPVEQPDGPAGDAGPGAGQSVEHSSVEHSVEIGAGMAALRRAVAGLPPDQRVCWVLRELEGLGYAEIAEITGAGQDAVRGRIHRARVRLAEVMRPWR